MVRTPHPEESPELYADVGTPDRARRCACEVRARVHAEQGRTNRRTPARRHRTIARHHLVPFTSMRCRPMLCGLPPPPRLRNPARRPAQSRQHPGILSQLLRQQPSAASAARHLAGKQHWCRPREQADAHANEERKQAHAQDHRAPAQHLRRRSPEQGDAAARKDTNFFFLGEPFACFFLFQHTCPFPMWAGILMLLVAKVGAVSNMLIGALKGYKALLSPLLPPSCRFFPTCSIYGMESIKKFGPTKGLF